MSLLCWLLFLPRTVNAAIITRLLTALPFPSPLLPIQIAACGEVTCVNLSDVNQADLDRERAIEMGKEDILSKPEAIRGKIVDGRVEKIAKTMALMEQSFIKDSNKTVADHIKEQIAGIGENIQVRRFKRFVLGEGIEKKVSDFAAEVAEATGGKV